MTTPAPGPARSIGSYSLGCIEGAQALPDTGPGYQAIRLSRSRFWGHPDLLRAVESVAARAQQAGLPILWIGDLSQPRGGHMPTGHASHQIGLDADIWLDLNPKKNLSIAGRERLEIPSLVRPDGLDVVPGLWRESHATLIRIAATTPGVERVFVNAAIKQQLCRTHAGEAWMHKVRPWWGHASHFHMRIACPVGDAACVAQPPIPAGDGCDASLAWWFTDEALHPQRGPAKPAPQPPAACAAVLRAP